MSGTDVLMVKRPAELVADGIYTLGGQGNSVLVDHGDGVLLVDAGPGAAIAAWGRLGYPRRARALHDAAMVITRHGWPADLTELPGVGRYTAGAVAAQVDDADVTAVDVNIRRVCERVEGAALKALDADRAMIDVAAPLRGRDRLLALMDLGATVCTARAPRCDDCPLHARCATRGVRAGEGTRRAAPYAGSFRQRRGQVLAALRAGPTPAATLDAEALASLVIDGLAELDDTTARLPRASTGLA